MKKCIPLSLLLIAATIPQANASSIPNPMDESSRKDRGEFYGIAEYLTGWETTKFHSGDDREFSLKIDSGLAGGVGFGWNFNEHLNLNTTITGGSMDFEARGLDETDSGDTAVVQWAVSLDYHVLKTRLTPLLTTGAGVTYFSGDFNDSWINFGEANFSWGVGGGVRWDISDHWFAKAIYRVNWTNLEKSDNATRFNSVALAVGYTF